MDDLTLHHLHPTAEILAEELVRSGIPCRRISGDSRNFRGVRIYSGGPAAADILYLVSEARAGEFPAGGCCISARAVPGCVILCPEENSTLLLDQLLEIFLRFQDMEQRLDALVHRGADTNAFCALGEEFLDNPVCIHDDWFIVTAMSPKLPDCFSPERNQASDRLFIPRSIVEEFRIDPDYQETFRHRTTQIWNGAPNAPNSLYVNLWLGEVYRGRLLVMHHRRDFRPADFLIAQCLAQRVTMLLQRRGSGADRTLRSMDRTVFALLRGESVPSQDEAILRRTLSWDDSSKLVCIRIQNQQPGRAVVLEHILHTDLFRRFPGSYIMFDGTQQCVILKLNDRFRVLSQIRHALAPLCRDHCLYAGISSPVLGPGNLDAAYRQAEVALNQAFRLRCEKWIIPFSDCALDYTLSAIRSPLPPAQLAAPELRLLMEQDRETGTQYFETLKTYLILERDIPKTATALIIHRTTLLYRLKKIAALTELDLDDPNRRLYLLLSLYLLEREAPAGRNQPVQAAQTMV